MLVELGQQHGPYRSGTLMRLAVNRHARVMRDIEYHIKHHQYHEGVKKALFWTKEMKQLGEKLIWDGRNIWHYCPGCDSLHMINHNKTVDNSPCWSFNHDLVNPTFDPSVKLTWWFKDQQKICHYFVIDGKINYCQDSFHDLKGQSVFLSLPQAVLEDWSITEKIDAIPSGNANAN